MQNTEAMQRRREADIKKGEEEFALALTRTLVILRFKGNCKCGMMLTERDQKPDKVTYSCPHCGRSGPLMEKAAT